MKDLAIYKLGIVGGAVDQLEGALADLERALGTNPKARMEIIDGDADADTQLADALAENEVLRATTREVSQRLDVAIARVQAILDT